MLSAGLPRLWLCAPPARKDASCAGHHIYARVKPVHVLFIPWYAPNSVCIRIFGCLESVCNMIGWPAHMLPHKQSNHSTTSHLYPCSDRHCWCSASTYLGDSSGVSMLAYARTVWQFRAAPWRTRTLTRLPDTHDAHPVVQETNIPD